MFISKVLKQAKTLKPWSNITSNHLLDFSIKRASGSYYILKDNSKIVDFSSGLMVTNLGHNNKYINKKMKKFIDKGLLYSPPSIFIDEREKLSQRLIENSPIKNGKVFYTNGGADANESSIYFARNNKKNKGNRILRFEKSFHGGSSYISSFLGGDKRRNQKLNHFNLDIQIDNILPNPSMIDNGKKSLEIIENILNKNSNNICAVLIEGSSGTGGIYTYPENYLNQLDILFKKHNILVIVDEVMSGFGRTGKMFAVEHSNLKPDMITMAKGLTNGNIPMGGVIISEELCNNYKDDIVWNGLTYSGHPLACVTANACLDLYLKNNKEVIRNCDNLGKILQTKLKIYKEKYPEIIKDVRGIGLLSCIEFKDEYLKLVIKKLYEKRINTFSNDNNLFIAPPLNIDEKLFLETMDKIEDILIEINN